MDGLRRGRRIPLLALGLALWAAVPAQAVPLLQLHPVGSVAGDLAGEDEDTWFATGPSLDLELATVYHPRVQSIGNAGLVLTVPEGATPSCAKPQGCSRAGVPG